MRAPQAQRVLRAGLVLLLIGALGPLAWSQAPPKGASATKKDAPPDPPKAPSDEAVKASPGPEVFRDPRVRQLLNNDFDQLFRRDSVSPQQNEQIRAMADKGAPNPEVIKSYVKSHARELTDHKNIEAMLDPNGNPTTFKNLEEAASRLAIPLEIANARKNVAFRREFVKAMIAPGVGDALLKNHLYSRVQFIIALSASNEPTALDFFNAVLADRDQPAIVKLQAARGITRVVAGAKVDSVDASTRVKSAKAVSDFLNQEPDSMWPALDRALEALGALRQDSFDPSRGDLEFLTTAMKYVTAPAAATEVRARAVWAVGMIRLGPNTKVNYPLIAAHAGAVALEVADKALADYDPTAESPDLNAPTRYWVARFLTQVNFGFKGDPEENESGILTLASRALRGEELRPVSTIEERARDIGKAFSALLLSAGTLRTQEKANVTKAVAELRAYLEKNPPKDTNLFPGGPAFPLGAAPVAAR